MVDKNKKPKTEKVLGQDPFEGLFGPEWEEVDNETTAAESITEADQNMGPPEAADEPEPEPETVTEIEAEANQATKPPETADEPEPELETTTEIEAAEIDQALAALAVAEEREVETAPVTAVEAGDDQTTESPEAPDELEPEFKAIAEIEAAEIDQAFDALAVAEEPGVETAPVAAVEVEAREDQTIELPEPTDEPEPEFEASTEVEAAEIDQAFEPLVSADEPEVETAPGAAVEVGDDQTTELPKAVEAGENLNSEENSNVLDEIIASIDREIEQSHESDLMTILQTEASGSRSENLEQYIIFTLAGATYAAAAANVREVGEMANLTPVPNVPDWLLGVTNLRGDILSVVDLHTFLSLEQPDYVESLLQGKTSYSGEREILVIHLREDASLMTAGLIVDEVNDIRYLSVDRITAPAGPIEDQVGSYLGGVYEDEDQLLVLLDFERLLLSPEMQQFETV